MTKTSDAGGVRHITCIPALSAAKTSKLRAVSERAEGAASGSASEEEEESQPLLEDADGDAADMGKMW